LGLGNNNKPKDGPHATHTQSVLLDRIFGDPVGGIPDFLYQPFLLQNPFQQTEKPPTPHDGRGA
jgi:hypothetical protein